MISILGNNQYLIDTNYLNYPKENSNCNNEITYHTINLDTRYDLEIYGKDPRDLSNMSYPKFLEKYKRIIKNSCDMLRDNSFAVFIVSEIRDINGKYKNFVRDTIEAFEECGLEYYNEMIYLNQVEIVTPGRIRC